VTGSQGPSLDLRAVESRTIKEMVRDSDENSGAEFWYCISCDGSGDTRDSIEHTERCDVGTVLVLLAHCRALRAALTVLVNTTPITAMHSRAAAVLAQAIDEPPDTRPLAPWPVCPGPA